MSNPNPHIPIRKTHKEGEMLPSQPDLSRNFRLVNDPAISRCPPLLYRYDGVLPGMKSPVETTDPRSRFGRPNARRNNFLPVPEFTVDKYYILPIKPKEVSFSNLNNNINVKFLEDMCKAYGTIQETLIYYHPTTKKHLGLGKVLFILGSSAQKCVDKLNDTSSMGNIMKVFLDDKGMERDKLYKELTKDPNKAEFIPPLPNSHLPKDVMSFVVNSASPGFILPSGLGAKPFASPGCEQTRPTSAHLPALSSAQSILRSHATNGENVSQRKISGSSNECNNAAKAPPNEGAFGNLVSGCDGSEFSNKALQPIHYEANHSNVVTSQSNLAPSVLSHRQQPHQYDRSQQYNSRDCRPHHKYGDPREIASRDKLESQNRCDLSSNCNARGKAGLGRHEERNFDRKRNWHHERDYRDHKSSGDRSRGSSGWKDKYSPHYQQGRGNRNRDKRGLYDGSHGRSSWGRLNKDRDRSPSPSPRKAVDNSCSYDDLLDGSRVSSSSFVAPEKVKQKEVGAAEKGGQVQADSLEERQREGAAKNKFSSNMSNILANSDDNAIDSCHLFVKQLRKIEVVEVEDDKHESLESRIQALLGQNLPFTLPNPTAPAPIVSSSSFQKSPMIPPLPPLPSPPTPPPPTQSNSDIGQPPPIYSYPPPPYTVPPPVTPVVPPNLSYPPPVFPLPVGSIPPLVAQPLDHNQRPVVVQWQFPPEAIGTQPPIVPLPSLNVPPPRLPAQGCAKESQLSCSEAADKEEEKAKFRKVFNEFIYQLKEVLSKDVKKKMIEVTAFKEFEDWWCEKNNEHNERMLSSRHQQMKPAASVSGGDLKIGEPKQTPSNDCDKSFSSVAPTSDRSQMLDTLSGLFDKSGSFAGGLLGLRNLRLTSLPSFRKKTEPPKKDLVNEKNNGYDDDEDDDGYVGGRRQTFRGPRTPEGSDNDENFSASSSESESDGEVPGKNYKPPSPPPSPVNVQKESTRRTKVKRVSKNEKTSKPSGKLVKTERGIYSSSSSLDSELSCKGVANNYGKSDGDDDDDSSGGSSDVDVMNLLKTTKDPSRKVAVYTSDEDESDGGRKVEVQQKQKGKAASLSSSPSVSESEEEADKCAVEKNLHKKSSNKVQVQKQKSQKSSTKLQKQYSAKRRRTTSKSKSTPNKTSRARSKSIRDDGDGKRFDRTDKNYMGHDDLQVGKTNRLTLAERKRSKSFALPDVSRHHAGEYDEAPPVDGYLHLLSSVASEIKQAEVNENFSSDLPSTKCGIMKTTGMEPLFRTSPDYPSFQDDESQKLATVDDSRARIRSGEDATRKHSLIHELHDHNYSLKPWMEVKSRKGRKPKHKGPGFAANEPELEASSGDETVSLFPSDSEETEKFDPRSDSGRMRLILHEHNYSAINISLIHQLDRRSEPSDTELDDSGGAEKLQVYVEEGGSGREGRKFTLETIPHIGKEVDVFFEKPEQEKNINVVDDEEEEEEGRCRTSSDEGRMVIDEGVPSKPATSRKRKRSTAESDALDRAEKKTKYDKKASSHGAKNSSRLPRELVNLFQSDFVCHEPKPTRFAKRDFKEESFILYEFVTKGIDKEDANFIRLQYEKMLQREQEKLLIRVESQCKWILDTKWVDHPVRTDADCATTKKSRKSSRHRGSEPQSTGCARSEGYYKIPHQEKKYLKLAHCAEEQHSALNAADDFLTSTTSSTSLAPMETTLDAMMRKRAQQNREARSEGRRWQNLLTSNLGEDVADMLKFNQLQLRRKQLKFAKSRIHDWGLFAMEPIAEGELVVEYVGQVIRQSVADVREKRYEAEGIGSSYLFRIDQNTIVDATRYGNLSRFINHCCNPNCYAKIVSVDGVKRIVIYSRRDVEVNEEITYDYKFPIENEKIPCLCGASGCRGTLN